MLVAQLDNLIRDSLNAFAADVLGSRWYGKEHDWLNRYAHGYLLRHCAPSGPLRDPGQVGIEIAVPQPPGFYRAAAVRRDLVIWPELGLSCWDEEWKPVRHPLAILEWKVHREGHRNPKRRHEREWLRRYTQWQLAPVAYAVEVDLGRARSTLTVDRFYAGSEVVDWLQVEAH